MWNIIKSKITDEQRERSSFASERSVWLFTQTGEMTTILSSSDIPTKSIRFGYLFSIDGKGTIAIQRMCCVYVVSVASIWYHDSNKKEGETEQPLNSALCTLYMPAYWLMWCFASELKSNHSMHGYKWYTVYIIHRLRTALRCWLLDILV